ncbi:MAG: methionine--tRNA ligase [Candidatus Nanohaloarchaea archaeon]
MARKTITSALPYIHGVPHLGNIVGSLLPADIFHRYQDLRGNDNIFVCGSDVHGTPLELEALEQNIPVEELKENNHEKVKSVLNDFDMDFSIYSNTHSDYNRKQTHDMFVELYTNGYIKEETQKLPYSDEDDRFLPDRYIEGECPKCGGLARGDQCDECGTLLEPEELIEPYSTISGSTDIEFRETEHLFLDLPQFKDELLEWLENGEAPIPDNKLEEVKNSIEETEIRCITRDINWGFEIPAQRVNKRIDEEGLDIEELDAEVYDEKVLYVWFDAPIGYIGFTRELFEDDAEWKDYWMNEQSDVYYSIGKDNTIFHTVIWPSILLGSNTEEEEYNLPHYEFIQQFLMAEDTKFSKSRGKGLSTEDALEMYPSDYWRFYLARNLPQQHDSTFSWDDFESEINNVLNDTVGNFVNRTLSLAEQWFDNEVPVADLRPEDREVEDEVLNVVDEYIEAFENHDLRTGVEKAVEVARIGDQYLSEEEPWNNEDRREETIHVSLHLIRAIGVMLYPYTPEASEKIADMLNTEIHTEEGDDELVEPLLGNLGSGHELGEKEILFEKIDVEEDRPEQEDKNEEASEQGMEEGLVSFDEFQDMDLRVGEVLEVEDHPNADKLYKVQLDVGEKQLQTCAGLVNHYEKEDLEGRQVIVLANLEPTELRGEKSECMMLAAEDEKENVELLGLENELKIGSEIR